MSRIKSARESLDQAFYKISEAIYRQAGTAGGPGEGFAGEEQRGPSEQGGPHDDTIEGEYKEM